MKAWEHRVCGFSLFLQIRQKNYFLNFMCCFLSWSPKLLAVVPQPSMKSPCEGGTDLPAPMRRISTVAADSPSWGGFCGVSISEEWNQHEETVSFSLKLQPWWPLPSHVEENQLHHQLICRTSSPAWLPCLLELKIICSFLGINRFKVSL